MRGRKPKPTVLKLLDGNPGKRRINGREPAANPAEPELPEGMDEEATKEWNRIVPELRDMGVLARADRAALAAYCTAWGRWRYGEAQVQKHGPVVKSPNGYPIMSPYLIVANQALEQMRKFLIEFGLTPSSRSRIRLPSDDDETAEFDRFTETG